MLPTPNRDLPEVVSELTIEMHEMRSELNILNDRVDRLVRTVEKGFQAARQDFWDEVRQNTDRFIDAFLRSIELFINRMLDHEQRWVKCEDSKV